jgi:hypothetical protein
MKDDLIEKFGEEGKGGAVTKNQYSKVLKDNQLIRP